MSRDLAVAAVLQHSRAQHSERLVLLAIAANVFNEAGQAYLMGRQLARLTGLTEKSTRWSVRALVGLGELEADLNVGPCGGTRYRLLLPEPYFGPPHRADGGRRPNRPKVPKRLRLAIHERDGYSCLWCGWRVDKPDSYDGSGPITVVVGTKRVRVRWNALGDEGYRNEKVFRSLVIDHIFPLHAGGSFRDPDNLQSLCSTCNGIKGSRIPLGLDAPAGGGAG
jgi:hypothetical protein